MNRKADGSKMWGLIAAAVIFVLLFWVAMGSMVAGVGKIADDDYVQMFMKWSSVIHSACNERSTFHSGVISVMKHSYFALVVGDGLNLQHFNDKCFGTVCFCMFRKGGFYPALSYVEIDDLLGKEFVRGVEYHMPNVATVDFKVFNKDTYMSDLREWTDFLLPMKEDKIQVEIDGKRKWGIFEDYSVFNCQTMTELGCNICESGDGEGYCKNLPSVFYNPYDDDRLVVLLIGGADTMTFDNVQVAKQDIGMLEDTISALEADCVFESCISDSDCEVRGCPYFECGGGLCVAPDVGEIVETSTKTVLFFPILH